MTAPAKTAETVTEWGVRWPAGEYQSCTCEREARTWAADYTAVQVVCCTVTRTAWAPPAPPVLEANRCSGTGVLALPAQNYPPCPGCVGCDHDAVSARAAAMTAEQAFALLPTIDDERPW